MTMYSITTDECGPYLHADAGSFTVGGSTVPRQDHALDPWRSWHLTLRIDRELLAAIDEHRAEIEAALDKAQEVKP